MNPLKEEGKEETADSTSARCITDPWVAAVHRAKPVNVALNFFIVVVGLSTTRNSFRWLSFILFVRNAM